MGDANASIPTPQPQLMRPMFGAFGRATGATSLAFVSGLALQEGTLERYGLTKELSAVRGCRTIGKRDMKLNDALPRIEVDPGDLRRHRRRRDPDGRGGRGAAARAALLPVLRDVRLAGF